MLLTQCFILSLYIKYNENTFKQTSYTFFMQILNKDEYYLRRSELLNKINGGAIFIYPTDTIYGLGANALDQKAVTRIRDAKERPENPFSVIAP